MILTFPNLDCLQLALLTGLVPATVSQTQAAAELGADGSLTIETEQKLAQPVLAELKKLGVQVVRAKKTALLRPILCWPELIPLRVDPQPIPDLERTAVLFELTDGEQLIRLATEILRLGNDRQAFRWLEDVQGVGHALLQVYGPPYYSLLRALDAANEFKSLSEKGDGHHCRNGPKGAAHNGARPLFRIGSKPIAYLERAPGVWVQVGHAHPLATQIRPIEGQVLLIQPAQPCA